MRPSGGHRRLWTAAVLPAVQQRCGQPSEKWEVAIRAEGGPLHLSRLTWQGCRLSLSLFIGNSCDQGCAAETPGTPSTPARALKPG